MVDGRGHDRPLRMQCLARAAQSIELAALEMKLDEARFDVEAVDRTDADLGLAGRGQFRRKALAFAEGSGAVFNRERAIENRRPGQPMQLFTQQRAIAGVGFNGDDPGPGDHRCERERHGAMMRAAVEESLRGRAGPPQPPG